MQYLLQFSAQHTPGHVDCLACREHKNRALMRITPEQLFEEAAQAFYELRCLETHADRRAVYVEKNTLDGYQRQTRSLKLFFAGMRLIDIHWYNIRAFQDARANGAPPFVRHRRPQDAKPRKLPGGLVLPPKGPTPCLAKPEQINQEVAFLKRLKVLSGCWTAEDEAFHKELKEVESEVQRAQTIEEQDYWLKAANSNPRWELIFHYCLVAYDSCCSTNELRALRLGDIKLNYHMISIPWPGAKNKHRHREILIESADTEWALLRLIDRARELGAGEPHLNPTAYLFPFRDPKTRQYDPTRPMTVSGLKKLWQEVREATGQKWFRPYDTRHTAITRLAERGVPIDVIMARAGHVGEKMRQHYTHITLAGQRQWLQPSGPSVFRFGPQKTFSPARRISA